MEGKPSVAYMDESLTILSEPITVIAAAATSAVALVGATPVTAGVHSEDPACRKASHIIIIIITITITISITSSSFCYHLV
jgi:hypothetical protein